MRLHYRMHLDLDLTIAQAMELETIHSGHFDNLVYEDERFRVWRSRMTVADGAPCDNMLTLEHKLPRNYTAPYAMGHCSRPGEWMTYRTYDPERGALPICS